MSATMNFMSAMLRMSILVGLSLVALPIVLGDSYRRWERAMSWCWHSEGELHLGDFNGDTRLDLFCHDKNNGHKWISFAARDGTFTNTDWERAMGWCNHAGAQLFIGDFNGDGRSDMLCHDMVGHKWISFANSEGVFVNTNWERALGWCYHSGAQLFIGDFNGDGRDDMLCHDTNNGYKWTALANKDGQFTGTSWERAMAWCYHSTAELHIGDFNGDGRSDLLCHDTSNGYKWISFAVCDGSFTGTSWERDLGWCFHSGSSLHIEDFNGDGRDDMLCHDQTGSKLISYANVQGNFNDRTGWELSMSWCYHNAQYIFVGDFDGDNHSDMLCHDFRNGRKWIAFASLSGRFT